MIAFEGPCDRTFGQTREYPQGHENQVKSVHLQSNSANGNLVNR